MALAENIPSAIAGAQGCVWDAAPLQLLFVCGLM